jgi:hypothetical protein
MGALSSFVAAVAEVIGALVLFDSVLSIDSSFNPSIREFKGGSDLSWKIERSSSGAVIRKVGPRFSRHFSSTFFKMPAPLDIINSDITGARSSKAACRILMGANMQFMISSLLWLVPAR